MEIPKLPGNFELNCNKPGEPGWLAVVSYAEHKPCKPIIRCMCGNFVGLKLHHVHTDGTVTASFYHKKGVNFAIGEDPNGCEWHVTIKLRDYSEGDFPPVP